MPQEDFNKAFCVIEKHRTFCVDILFILNPFWDNMSRYLNYVVSNKVNKKILVTIMQKKSTFMKEFYKYI